MKKLQLTFTFIFILIFSITLTCNAVDTSYLVDRLNGKYSHSIQNESNKPQSAYQTTASEVIDPLTGSLTLQQTDLVLPGRDGFDLKLERYYNSSQADFFNPKAGVKIATQSNPCNLVLYPGEYLVTVEVYDNVIHQTYYEYYGFLDNAEAQRKVYSVTKLNELEDLDNRFNVNATISDVTQYKVVTNQYMFTAEIEKLNYQRMRYNLGAGWAFSFPSVQVIRNDMNSEIAPILAVYFHKGDGSVYTVDLSTYKFLEAEGNNYVFWESGGSVNGRNVLYSYKDANEITYKFANKGELLQMSDRFGNNITFDNVVLKLNEGTAAEVRSNVISKITDSVGRVVNFAYTNTGDYPTIDVSVTTPGESKVLTLKYNKEMVNVEDKTEGHIIGKEPILKSFVNTNGETTQYFGANAPVPFSYTVKTIYTNNDYQFVYRHLLTTVVYPHSISKYDYGQTTHNLGEDGVIYGYRVTTRNDYDVNLSANGLELELGENRNYAYYENDEYGHTDYTGYPYYNATKIIPNGYYLNRVVNSYGTRSGYLYANNTTDQYHPYLFLSIESSSINLYSDNQSNTSKTYKEFNYKKKPELIETTTSGNGGSYTTYTELKYYDTSNLKDGLLKSVTLPLPKSKYDDYWQLSDHRTTYDYTYGEVSRKEWKKDLADGYVASVQSSYNNKQRIEETYGVGNRKSFTYEYKTGTNIVTKRTIMIENGGNDEKIEEYYTADTNYTYPSEIREYYKDENGVERYRSKTYTYDMVWGKVKTVIDANGTITYEYDNLGRVTKETYPVYETTTTQLNSTTGITEIVTKQYRKEREITYGHNSDSITDGLIPDSYGRKLYTVFAYDRLKYYDVATGNLVFITQTWNDYDGFGNLVWNEYYDTVNGAGAWLINKYYYNNDFNKVSRNVDPLNNSTSYEYDALGRLSKTTDPYLNQYIAEFESSVTSMGTKSKSYFIANGSSAKENVVELTNDTWGRTVEKNSYGLTEKYSYDLVSNLTAYTDANNNLNSYGVTNKFVYDGKNRLTDVINAKNETVLTSYDEQDNIISSYVSGNRSFTKTYDAQGRIVEDKDPSDKLQIYRYDSLGRLEQHIDRNNINSFYEYDKNNNISARSSFTANSGVEFVYENTSPYGASAIYDWYYQKSGTQWDSQLYGIVDKAYTPTGNLIYNNISYPSYSGYAQYKYDSLGRPANVLAGTLKNSSLYGAATNYSYNKTRLEKVQLDGVQAANTSDSVNAKYEYYPNGKLKSITYPPLDNGKILKMTETYDSLDRLKTLTNSLDTAVLSKFEYDYDDNGNVVKAIETKSDGIMQITHYIYDKLNRLISEEIENGRINTYKYDNRGNRIENYTNEVLFDESSVDYYYDELNRLYQINRTDENGSYKTTFNDYTADGLRYLKSVNSSKTYYVYNQDGKIATELNATGNVTASYIHAPDRILEKIASNGSKYYYLYNGHTDVVQIINATTGNIVNQYRYDCWGNFINKSEGTANPFTYFGQTYDESTGLYYLRSRYYDPKTGQFTQEDTIRDGMNWYAYCGANPIMYVDPTGQQYVEVLSQYAPQISASASQLGLTVAQYTAMYGQQIVNTVGTYGGAAWDWSTNTAKPWLAEKAQQTGQAIGNTANNVAQTWNNVTGGDPNNWKNGQSGEDVINKANHVFGKSEHNLNGLLKKYSGNTVKAYRGITDATQKYVKKNNITENFETILKVKGYNVTIRGTVINGMARISTAFIP
jgi:RHS repeat-associated protein